MSCCGDNREKTRTSIYTNAASRSARPAPPSDAVKLRYVGSSAILVRGPVSGAGYAFSSGGPAVPVDPRDMEPLLRTFLFRREGS